MRILFSICCLYACSMLASCNSGHQQPSPQTIESIDLKKGDMIVCGPSLGNFGSVHFLVSASADVKKDFDQAVAMLHSFEYDEAEKSFAKIIAKDPSCAMAYWGVAMSNFHPLWEAPNEPALKKGAKAIEIARSIDKKTSRESEYIEAIARFYLDRDKSDHRTRCLNYEKAMGDIHTKYPSDREAAVFYALALNTTAVPTDKSYTNQKKAGEILNKILNEQPNHPGIIHYIIHNYDNPELAGLALPAARKYASIAPASAHAQHMPSHIFTRLGLWDESVNSNLASIASAKCYAEGAGIKGTLDEELHGMDYLMYAYLQKGNNDLAKEQLNYLRNIKKVSAQNFKVAYAYASIPARYVLENRMWHEAANLEFYPADFPWDKFPWQQGIIHYARIMGMVHTNDIEGADRELNKLKDIHANLASQNDQYKARHIEVQLKAGDAWIQLKKGNSNKAIGLMGAAADLEDGTEKHPVTPGEVLPAREMLGDMFLSLQQHTKALEIYETVLKSHPNRFNGLYGAGLAAERSGNFQKAQMYYTKLTEVAGSNVTRPELEAARKFLNSSHAKL